MELKGEGSAARELLHKVLETSPGSIVYLKAYAGILERQRSPLAREAYEKLAKAQSHSPQVDAGLGFLTGIASGFTSQIAHAGLPPFQMWVLRKKLPPTTFIGTAALYFAILNWVKVPAYAALGQFTPENLLAALTLMPVAIASTIAGVVLVKRVPAEGFYTIIYLLMIGVGIQLIWKAVV